MAAPKKTRANSRQEKPRLAIVYRPLAELTPYANNARTHSAEQVAQIAASMRERVTGGTVYRLSNRMDGGAVLDQRHVLIRPDDTAETLWRRDLGPLGVELLRGVVARMAAEGYVAGREQDEELATWEPGIDRPPAFRPDLLMLPAPDDDLRDMAGGGHALLARGL